VSSPERGLGGEDLPVDDTGLLAGLVSTRAIRLYHDEPVPRAVLRAVCFAATRAPTDSNRQTFRFLVLADGPKATEAKALIAVAARQIWAYKREAEGYEKGSGLDDDSPKARMNRTMERYIENLDRVPAVILPCVTVRGEATFVDGASVFPASQNLLLAARALGYGGVMTTWHLWAEAELRALLEIPDDVHVAATITLGRPLGGHGPVRRRPLPELVFEETWGATASWIVDPPGTRHTGRAPERPDTDPTRPGDEP
jgi:nitroreductase